MPVNQLLLVLSNNRRVIIIVEFIFFYTKSNSRQLIKSTFNFYRTWWFHVPVQYDYRLYTNIFFPQHGGIGVSGGSGVGCYGSPCAFGCTPYGQGGFSCRCPTGYQRIGQVCVHHVCSIVYFTMGVLKVFF